MASTVSSVAAANTLVMVETFVPPSATLVTTSTEVTKLSVTISADESIVVLVISGVVEANVEDVVEVEVELDVVVIELEKKVLEVVMGLDEEVVLSLIHI